MPSNAPYNISSTEGTGAIPSAFKIKDIELVNHEGKSYFITSIVVEFTLSESIYSTTTVCKLTIRDSNDLFNDFKLTGQEIVRITLLRDGIDDSEKEINIEFYVTEYPLYGRGDEKHTQIYKLTAISKHNYTSNFKRISRKIEGLTSGIIKNIFKSDLSTEIQIDDEPITRFKGIINTQSPLSAVEWLRKKTYDDKKAPYYIFQTLDGIVHMKSHTSLVKQKPYMTYYDGKGFNYAENDPEGYLQKRHRIIEIASDLKLGKIFQGKSGAYASENFYLDIANKTFTSTKFSYNKRIRKNSLGKEEPISNQFKINEEETIDKMYDAHHEYISTNSYAFNEYNYNELKKESAGITQGYTENMDTMSHQLTLFGDLNLNAGTVIEVKIPRAIDPAIQNRFLRNSSGMYDDYLSGKYIITSAIHTFKDGKYYTNVKVKRDSFSVKL